MRYLIVMLLAVSAFAQKPKNDGNFWVNSSPSFKIGWVSCAATLPMYAEKYPNIAPKDLMQKLCLDNKSTDFDAITMGQFVDGMDQFYRDFRNKQLYMTWAIEYVRDQLKGKSADDLSVELTTWRNCSRAEATGDSGQIAKACSPPEKTEKK
jgi:hypothetical protein